MGGGDHKDKKRLISNRMRNPKHFTFPGCWGNSIMLLRPSPVSQELAELSPSLESTARLLNKRATELVATSPNEMEWKVFISSETQFGDSP